MTAILGTFGTLSIIVLFYILAKLSEKFGSVIKMTPLYRYYYLAIGFLVIAYFTNWLVIMASLTPATTPAWFTAPWFLFLAFQLPRAIGVTISLVVTWRYWSWLILERNG